MRIAVSTLAVKGPHHGMGRYLINLLAHLLPHDKNNQYLLYITRQNQNLFKEYQSNHVRAKVIHLPISFRILWEQTLLPIDLLREKAAVYFGPSHILPLIKTVPQVVTIHDLSWFTQPSQHTLIKRIYFKNFIPQTIKRADRIIAVSSSTQKDLQKILKVPGHKIQVIREAVEDSFKKAAPEEVQKVKKKYSLPRPYIFNVGVIEPRKNQLGLVRAYARILQKSPRFPFDLVIAGSIDYGWKNKPLFALIEKPGLENRVRLLGKIPNPDLVALLSGAKLFVYPSFYEGFGLPVLEAMGCGAPVITSNASSLPEVGGAAAFYINPHQTDSIQTGIAKVLSDENLQQTMIKKGYEQVKKFSWEKTARQTLKALTSVA